MTQSNISFPRGQQYLLIPRGVMAVEVCKNEEIFGGGKNEGEKKSVLLSVEEQIGGA